MKTIKEEFEKLGFNYCENHNYMEKVDSNLHCSFKVNFMADYCLIECIKCSNGNKNRAAVMLNYETYAQTNFNIIRMMINRLSYELKTKKI